MSVKLTSCPHVSDCIVMFLIKPLNDIYLFCNFFVYLQNLQPEVHKGTKAEYRMRIKHANNPKPDTPRCLMMVEIIIECQIIYFIILNSITKAI